MDRREDFRLRFMRVDRALTRAMDEARKKATSVQKVDELFPEWRLVVETPWFRAWFDAQPRKVRALARSTKAKDAIKMLELYERDAVPW